MHQYMYMSQKIPDPYPHTFKCSLPCIHSFCCFRFPNSIMATLFCPELLRFRETFCCAWEVDAAAALDGADVVSAIRWWPSAVSASTRYDRREARYVSRSSLMETVVIFFSFLFFFFGCNDILRCFRGYTLCGCDVCRGG